jgi:23S rRNA (guanine1835-N2)-methyltransferase
MPESENFITPFGSFTLELHLPDSSRSLRAWDAADEFLLQELSERGLPAGARPAVFNDAFGALTAAVRSSSPDVFLDSAQARFALNRNLSLNGLEGIPEFASLRQPTPGPYTCVLIKIPGSLSLLKHQLRLVRPALRPGTLVIGGGMTRHIHTSTLRCFESIVGRTRSTPARKKARLIISEAGTGSGPCEGVPPAEYAVPGIPAPLVNLPGVFSAERLDPGTRLFLKALTIPEGPLRILDFGCGNGVIGIFAALVNTGAKITSLDDSRMAVDSARINAARNGVDDRLKVLHAFSLDSVPGRFDLIVSNPPFHQGARISLDTSLQMFNAAARKLVPGGRLCIVANRHLGYAAHLRRLFGNCRERAGTKKFTLLEAERR